MWPRSRAVVTAVILGFHYVRGIYCLAERSLASQEGLCFSKSVIFFTETEERMKISMRWPYDGVQLRSDKLLVCSNMAELLFELNITVGGVAFLLPIRKIQSSDFGVETWLRFLGVSWVPQHKIYAMTISTSFTVRYSIVFLLFDCIACSLSCQQRL